MEATAGPYGIFLDARDLGVKVTFLQRGQCTANIADVLTCAGARYYSALDFNVHGALLYTPETGTVTYGHRSLLKVKVDMNAWSQYLANAQSGDGDPDSGGQGNLGRTGNTRETVDEGHGPEADRSRSPRRHSSDGGQGGGSDAGSANANDDVGAFALGGDQYGTILEQVPGCQRQAAMKRALERLEGREPDKKALRPKENPLPQVGGRPVATPGRCSRPPTTLAPGDHCALPPITLRLEQHVGPRSFDVQQQCVRLMSQKNEDALQMLARPWPGFQLRSDVSAIPLKECTLAALQLCSETDELFCISKVELYTDGSAKDGKSGFAVAMIVHDTTRGQRRTSLLGFLAGQVDTDDSSAQFVGASLQDALQAEATAVIWAILLGPCTQNDTSGSEG